MSSEAQPPIAVASWDGPEATADFTAIYDHHAPAYDELVGYEDHQGNLAAFLLGALNFAGARVVEAGIGTGRVTALYAPQAGRILGTDRSAHMLERARANLARFADKLTLVQLDNLALGHLADCPALSRADILIEGWSFGHVIHEHPQDVPATVRQLLAACARVLAPAGTAVIIETLGTAVAEPAPPDPLLAQFYLELERHGFTRHTLATDYAFPTTASAVSAIRFFFGEDVADRVAAAGSPVVGEFTGVWLRTGLPDH